MRIATVCSRVILTGLVSALLAADSRPLVVDAAKSGDREALKALIQKKADVNAADADGSTALHWASYRDDGEGMDLLIRAGANVNAVTDLGATALWTASQNGSVAMVRRLLAAGANPNLALLSGETALMVASRSGYPQVVELLIGKGAKVDPHGTRGQTALMWAASQQHADVVRVLLAHGANLNLRSDVYNEVMAIPPHGYLGNNKTVPHGGETALVFAARVGDLASAKLLLAAGANVNDADAWGVTALSYAAHSGFGELLQMLLDKGANPNLAECGFAPLHEAIMRRDEKMIAALLEHGADAKMPLKAWTPTRRSSDDWHFEPSLVGATPLWLAARFVEPSVIQMLVKRGADPLFVHHADYVAEQGFGQAPRKETVTPVMAALGMIRVDPWEDIPRAQKEALTLETVKALVDLGVDLNVVNTDGRTALDAAKALKYDGVVALLTAKGAKAGTAPARPAGARGTR